MILYIYKKKKKYVHTVYSSIALKNNPISKNPRSVPATQLFKTQTFNVYLVPIPYFVCLNECLVVNPAKYGKVTVMTSPDLQYYSIMLHH